MIKECEQISNKLKKLYDENLPINIYSDGGIKWFEFDVLGMDFEIDEIKEIEKLTNSICISYNRFRII